MKNSSTLFIILIFFLHTCSGQSAFAQDPESTFSHVIVKKIVGNRICDTCKAEFALDAEPDFSYVITGSGHTPPRFYHLKNNFKVSSASAYNTAIHLISQRIIGVSLLPNFTSEQGRRIQLYRNFGGDDYSDLEFSAKQNDRIISPWTALSSLKEDSGYAILGSKTVSGKTITKPWKRSYFAGRFSLNINDSLFITIRNIHTKKIVKIIQINRPPDNATNFVYYQMLLTGSEISSNIQNILNTGLNKADLSIGDSSGVFEKDYSAIGFLRFNGMGQNEVLQYSFENSGGAWSAVQARGPENAGYIVLGNNMPPGRDQDIYLRYSTQPETIHKITIRVKPPPFQMPWVAFSITSILLLTAGMISFYLWNKRSGEKLDALRHQSMDTEIRLSLLSGQLNPHFLFNSLNAIQGTINDGNSEKATAYLGSVAGFMRDVIDNSKKEFVSLKEELKIEEDYLKLEQQRTSFTYIITTSADLSPQLIEFPPMLLQPVLENSIRHAFGQGGTDPVITINIYAEKNTLITEVRDNGIDSWDVAGTEEGHGLSLTRKRIAVYNEKFGQMSIHMDVKSLPGTGTITTFTFQNWLT